MPTSKPTNIDAQRILAIMDELKEKLTFLSVVTAQVLEGLQSEEGQPAQELLGSDLVKAIQEQIRLEDLYVVANSSATGNYGQGEDNEDVREDQKSLQKNTMELCRKMKAVPNVVQELRNFQEHRPQAVIQFLKTLADMQELTLKRLTTTVEEEKSRQELLEHYKSREAEASKLRQQLEKDLAHIHRETESAQSQRTQILTKLKADLQDVKDSKFDRMNTLRQRYENRMKDHQDAFNERREKYQKEIDALKEANRKLKDESQSEENAQKKAKKRYEVDVDNIIKQYDASIADVEYNLNENKDGLKREERQLRELREHFLKVDRERDCIMQEQGIADARKAKMEAEKGRRDESAAVIQGFWRGIIQREQYMTMKKSKKKKGKGGKGGKKK
mmetsp:Transcript_31257/g.72896  ORF Transcript_31257/g.72896 Transcript_31257/m.72896 type:complete len:389 (-) Transcript_31257:84-1250(-)|eukprot:CAMPEP_0178400940 /NCGR_PEP_ID=MMETSP0689_2-20121128/16046_1 /TAXON_ID=160604 /ORGANISM="Amphidinium massartii, Strain CS-259" /LENGTH=388 /DNA_ID=CAMNT_0020021747 /DNA_START=153 /DNA_END=1319 /DNA_ORIENTATION=+